MRSENYKKTSREEGGYYAYREVGEAESPRDNAIVPRECTRLVVLCVPTRSRNFAASFVLEIFLSISDFIIARPQEVELFWKVDNFENFNFETPIVA